IHDLTKECIGLYPCLFQAKVGQAIAKGDQDIVCIAGTGQCKTLGFLIPLLL
ncbi:hypothetical protein SERLA73DRAFT_39036, partial [Serpula lacrymans var. lacrymans S7.3]